MIKNCLISTLFSLLFLANTPQMAWAEIKVELKRSDSTLLLGDEITVQLKVDGTQSGVQINFPQLDGLQFRQIGSPSVSSQTIIINGNVNSFSGLVYTIGISAEKTGSFEIPGFEVTFNGKSYKTKGFRLVVKEPGQQSNMKVTVETPKNTYYWQEPITVTLKWFLQDDIEDYEFRFPLLAQKKQLNVTLKEHTTTGAISDVTVQGYKVPFFKSEQTLDGEAYTVFQTDFLIVPTDPGVFKLSPASVKAMVREGTELKRDFFGRMVRAPKLKRIFAASQSKNITVLSLPTESRPAYFTGGVGRFQINTSIENTQVKVGDPIELSIKISGKGRYEKIEPPLLTENSELKENFTINTNLQPGDILPDGVVFKQIIRPRHDKVFRIPSIKFSFFNPLLETYQTIESKPIPLKVLATGRVKKEDVVIHRDHVSKEVQSFTRENKGIYANYIFEDALVSQTVNWGWLLLLICPPTIYIGVLIAASRTRRLHNDASLIRARSAKSVGSQRLKQARKLIEKEGDDFYLELSRTLRGYVADKLNLGAGDVTTVDFNQLGNKGTLPESLTTQLVAILNELDQLRFMGGEHPASDRRRLFDEVSHLIPVLEKTLR